MPALSPMPSRLMRGPTGRASREPVGPPYGCLRSFLLLRSIVSNSADHRGLAELPAQIVDRTLGMGGAAVQHVGVVGLRACAQRADAGAHQTERGAVDLLQKHLA